MEQRGWRRAWNRCTGPLSRTVAVVVLSVFNTLFAAWTTGIEYGQTRGALVLGVGLVASAAMWWRRPHPLLVFGIVLVAYLAVQTVLPLGFALLTIAVQRRDRVLVVATVLTAAAFALPSPVVPTTTDVIPTLIAAGVGALFWAMWGAYVGARRDLVASLQGRAMRAEQEREQRAEQARLAERSRIAREMHDVVAHKVSLIALQAGALEVNPGVGAERVEQSAALIRSTAREAMEDLRGVLGVLRADESMVAVDGSELLPQSGFDQIELLVAASRAAGVTIEARIEPIELPETVGRTVHRVVQESLTNVHKHARGAATIVEIVGRDGQVEVSVINRRPVAAGSLLPGSGAGLIGLRERVALLGGTLDAGPTSDGGWRVQASLPTPATIVAQPGSPAASPDSTGGGGRQRDRGAAWHAS